MAAQPAEQQKTLLPTVSDLNRMRRGDDDDAADVYVSPFAGIEKSSVLQEAAHLFNDPNTVKNAPQKCVAVITKLLFLLAQGEKFVGNEASDVFFAVTKLFQSQDLALRRMTYLFLKEVAESTQSEEIIIVTASLTRDMNSSIDMFRANAIRVLCKIVEANMLMQIERYMKQAMVDRDDQVAAAALMSADQMATGDPAKRRVVANWLPEIQSALSGVGRLQSVQYHALLVLYRIKQQDRLAVSKLVTQLSQGSNLQSSMAVAMLVRFTSRLLHDEMSTQAESAAAFKFLTSCLRHKSEAVIYEAARCICRLPGVTQDDVAPAIAVLANFLKSSSTTSRFAAARTLSEVAIRHPHAVSKANYALESLIQDRNRSVATMAITTLLKTGSEQSIEPLTKQISLFMTELADEFKIVVVNAIRALTLKYKKKHRMLLAFLSSVLREEGGYEIKKAVVDTILEIIDNIPDALETGLTHLCEFIEDCEFSNLATQVLHVLGDRGYKTPNPAKLIRYVYNRVILENAQVRAAAVSALGAFAIRCPQLAGSIRQLLKRCQTDEDDEVRDRATTCLALITKEPERSDTILLAPLPSKASILEEQLKLYQQQMPSGPVTFAALPHVAVKEKTDHELAVENAPSKKMMTMDEGVEGESHVHERAPASQEELFAIPQFASYGQLFKSSEAVELTERETEYLVRCVKHVFPNHVVLQFFLTNTLNDQLLTDVKIQLTPAVEPGTEPTWAVHHVVPVKRLPYDITKSAFVSLARKNQEGGLAPPPQTFAAQLLFTVHDVDPDAPQSENDDEENEGGFPETYAINDFEIGIADFMQKKAQNDFKGAWDAVGDKAEFRDQFALPDNSLDAACKSVIDFLGMRVCENTDVVAHNASKHSLLMAGNFIGNKRVLAHALLTFDDKKQIILKIAVRSDDPDVSKAVLQCISG